MTEQEADLVFGENDRERLAVLDLNVAEDAPLRRDAEVIVEEDTQSHLGLVHGGRLVVFLLAEEDEVVADLAFGEGARIGLEVLAEHANVGEVGIDRARSVVPKLDKLAIGL